MRLNESSTERAAVAARSIVDLFLERCDSGREQVAMRWKSQGIWREVSWAAYRAHVENAARGLLALGVRPGDRIAVIGRPTPDWLYLDLAAQSIGALPVPSHATFAPAQLTALLHSVRPVVVLLTRADELSRFLEVEPADARTGRILVGGDQPVTTGADPRVLTVRDLQAYGATARQADGTSIAWEPTASARGADEPAVAAVSVATSGDPRVALLSSRNLVAAWAWLGAAPLTPTAGDRVVSSMCLGEPAERALTQLVPILYGSVAHFPEDEVTVTEARREIRPTICFALPAVWEAQAAAVCRELARAPRGRRSLARLAGGGATGLRARAGRALVGRPVLAHLGYQEVRLALSGGAALAPDVAELWRGWGMALRAVYGSVECAGSAAVLAASGSRWLVADRPHGVELSLADDGELLVAGANVAEHYHDGTSTPRDDAGRLRTGDLAVDDGAIEVLGPAARRLRLSGGVTVDPVTVEAVLRGDHRVARAVVVCGEGWPVAGALLEPDLESIAVWAAAQRMSFATPRALLGEPAVRALLAEVFDAVARRIADAGGPQLGVHRVLTEPLGVGVDVAPSGSVRIDAGRCRHVELVDEMDREIGGRDRVREAATAMGGHGA
jgi:long-chain acyl-CoA synthetase